MSVRNIDVTAQKNSIIIFMLFRANNKGLIR